MPEMNMCYEGFIRRAFSLNKSTLIERFGDPAELANTDVFDVDCIEKVKAAVAYSMQIFKKNITANNDLSSADIENMDLITQNVINAVDKNTIYNLIVDFDSRYVQPYVTYRWEN
ncbi:hypothetical protein [Clostridium baratii]|uniref:hypothetical protein n=1 Tax=Clostridium baratii TaxID=1561 RepID=UPI00097FB2D9|nr:hypothetical protein [Clostridium baratii]AQM59981.1 hypothetical protein NPD11_434 [Clostridium baratii]